MTCSAASTLTPTGAASLLPTQLPTTQGAWQRVRTSFQQLLQMIQGAGGSIGNNVIPQQYALLAGSTLPPVAALSNCTVALDATTPLFGAGGSYKISITGSPATVTLSVPTAWPLSPNWQWIVSFFQRASAAISGVVTITTPAGAYATDFTTTLTAAGWKRLYDTLNLGADGSTTFGLSFTFTGGAGQTVWLDGLMLEAYFNVVIQPSPFMSTSSPLTIDNNPDGTNYVKLLGSHAAGNVAYNYRSVWSSATAYVVGDEVLYGASYWIAVAPSTNSAPPSANWQVVGSYSAFLGAWSSITTYAAGAEVTYAGNFWVAVAQNSNSAPSLTNANWQVAGPASLDNVADGSSYQRLALGNVLAHDLPYNGDFEQWANGQSVPDGWSSPDATSRTTTAFTGNYALAIGPNSAEGTYSRPFSVQPGMRYNLTEFAYCGAASAGGLYLRALWYSGDADNFSGGGNPDYITYTDAYANGGVAAAFTWQQVGGNIVAPSTARYCRIALYNVNTTTSYYVDRVAISPNTNQDYALDGTNYLRMPAPPSTSASSSGGVLTQTGTGAQFTVSAVTYYIGNLTMTANAGTVAPGSYNTFYVYFDSPNYAGGAVTYQVATDPSVLGQYPWRFYVGTITCIPSGGGSGGGGSRGPCFTGDVRIETPYGYRRFDELPERFEIVNRTGRHRAALLRHHENVECRRMGRHHLVTAEHRIRVGDRWLPARELFYAEGPEGARDWYNLHVFSDDPEDHHYILESGLTAHNPKL